MNELDLKSFITENPMLVEARRFTRKFFGASRGSSSSRVYLVLSVIVYLLLLGITIAFHNAFTAAAIIHFQTGILCFVVPALTYGAVAGEREKRTWELLLVAPISKAQIIVGKYLSALIVVLSVAALFLPLILFGFSTQNETLGGTLFAEAISLFFAFGYAALCILISARTYRSLTSQALIYSALFAWLVVYPMLVAAAFNGREGYQIWMWVHPFYAIAVAGGEVTQGGNAPHYNDSGRLDPDSFAGYSPLIQVLIYSMMAVICLRLAILSISSGNALDTERGASNAPS